MVNPPEFPEVALPRHLRLLGQGAFAEVLLGKAEDGSKVAVKRLRKGNDEHARESFEREAWTLANLQHERIVHSKGFGHTEEGTPFLLQEFVPGGTLATLLLNQLASPRSHIYSYEMALRWCAELAAAVEYLHNRPAPILHRDINPNNILLDKPAKELVDASIKLADFGLHTVLPSRVENSDLGEDSEAGLTTIYSQLPLKFAASPDAAGISEHSAADAPTSLPLGAKVVTEEQERCVTTALSGEEERPEAEQEEGLLRAGQPEAKSPETSGQLLQQAQSNTPFALYAAVPLRDLEDSAGPASIEGNPSLAGLLRKRHSMKSHPSMGAPSTGAPSSWASGALPDVYDLTGGTGAQMYQAPEVILEQPYGCAVDIYSFGVVCYELFSREMRSHRLCPLGPNPKRLAQHAEQVAREPDFRPAMPAIVDKRLSDLIKACRAGSALERPSASELVERFSTLIAEGVGQKMDVEWRLTHPSGWDSLKRLSRTLSSKSIQLSATSRDLDVPLQQERASGHGKKLPHKSSVLRSKSEGIPSSLGGRLSRGSSLTATSEMFWTVHWGEGEKENKEASGGQRKASGLPRRSKSTGPSSSTAREGPTRARSGEMASSRKIFPVAVAGGSADTADTVQSEEARSSRKRVASWLSALKGKASFALTPTSCPNVEHNSRARSWRTAFTCISRAGSTKE